MNKKQVFRDAVKHTPRFVHSILTWGKITSLEALLLSPEEVTKGEQDPVIKDLIIQEACKKHKEKGRRLGRQIERKIQESSCFETYIDKDYLYKDMLFCFFAYGYIPEEYAFYHLHEHTDEQYRRQYVTEITRLCCRYAMNDFTVSTYSNKDVEYERLKMFYKRDAVVIRGESDREKFLTFTQNHPRFIEKAAASSMGKDVCLVDLNEGNQTPENHFKNLIGGGTWLLEEIIRQSDDVAVFNASSVNTCRVTTFKTKEEILVPWGFMRCGRKGHYVDNAHQGGIFIAVDTISGKLIGDAMDTNGNVYVEHPDSGAIFQGYQLPEWDRAVDMIKQAAKEVPEVQYSSWDLAHTPNKGWVVVEVNPSGQFLWQASTQKGCKDEIRTIMKQMDLIVNYKLK